jgi:hypothetical protein
VVVRRVVCPLAVNRILVHIQSGMLRGAGGFDAYNKHTLATQRN